ncbi:MAG: PEGA domain-containing protein [Vicinamibacterales bacterium]
MMTTVLVVQPDDVQADVLRQIFAKRVGAELVIVDSTFEAVDEIARRMPDLILLSALLSPRDEDALIAHLRSLEGASHLQTITIPQFRTEPVKAPEKKGGLFRKKSKAPAPIGCDPMAFAEEVVARLKDACEIRNRPQAAKPAMNVIAPHVAHPLIEDEAAASASAFDTTPFQSHYVAPEPEPFMSEPFSSEPPVAEPVMQAPIEAVAEPFTPAPVIEFVAEVLTPAPVIKVRVVEEVARPARVVPRSIEIDEIDQLSRELGLNLKYVDTTSGPVSPSLAPADEGDVFDFGAALDRARNNTQHSADVVNAGLDAEAIRAAAIAEARVTAEREAREAVAADLARVQAEAEAMREAAVAESRAAEALREAAVAEAREAAVREAREKMDAELARMRSETEVTVAEALNKVRLETEEAERLRSEEARLRAEEAEHLRREEARLRAEEAERVRAEAEGIRAEAERVRIEAQQAQEAFASELARVRAEVEGSLTTQLDAARAESERMRDAEETAARERAGAEAQLKAELDRLKFVATQTRQADESESRRATEQIKQLEGELARVQEQADQRQAAQLEELRAQMADMREAAAQQARAAAAEAVASEVARAAAQSQAAERRKPNVVRMPARPAVHAASPKKVVAREIEAVAETLRTEERSSPSGDYYSLFQPTAAPAPQQAEKAELEAAGPGIDYRRHAKWALPVAACLLLVTNTGTAISTVKRLMTPAEKPALIVQPVDPEPFIEVVEQRVGSLKIDTTPAGAEAIVDGRRYGKTPLTIPDLEVGAHTLVLKSNAGTISRRITIKNNQTTQLSEAIFSGWLAIFSPIPIKVVIDGKPVNLTEDGRVMTTPGKHVVELVSERFNYRASETLEVTPGETTAHTVALPMGSVRVSAPEGAQIKVDGAPATGTAAEGLSMVIGSHEISATHPSLGERRASVDVRQGNPTDVTLRFEP